jgi:ABC-2 type transport system ATP-binding protein
MLAIKQLEVGYHDKLVINGLNLEVAEGSVHGILGMNGAGKTTLFNTLYGYVPKLAGTCLWKDKALSRVDIGYLETNSFFYPLQTGREYLQLCAWQHPDFPFEQWNAIFRLPLDQYTDTYSTGMRQKLSLLGLLAGDFPVLLLDEPFNGLDLESAELMYQLLEELKSQHKCILMSSHIVETVSRSCDRVSYLQEGRILQTFEREELTEMEKFIRTAARENSQEGWERVRKLKS